MDQVYSVRPNPIYRGQKPVRDPEYRRFVKKLPCAVCLKTWNVDPCHTGGHGTGQKSCDLSCIPLCRKHHDEFDAAPRSFAEKHGLDVPALIAKLNQFYAAIVAGRAA